MCYSKIVSVKHISKKRTIDIEVDNKNHTFYGNGIATSNSHAISYGFNAYLSAYCKAHYVKEFFTAYLRFANEKIKPQKEIYELINNAKSMDIWVMPPNIKLMNHEFLLHDGKIYFGLCDIKNVGKSVIEKLDERIIEVKEKYDIDFKDMTWLQFLFLVAPTIKKNSLESFVLVGACDCFYKTRTEMLLETSFVSAMSNREVEWVINNILFTSNDLKHVFNQMLASPCGRSGACSNKNRTIAIEGLLNTLCTPAHTLQDLPHQIAKLEYELLGVNITASMLDECKNRYKANCSCSEYNNGFGKGDVPVMIAGKIDGFRVIKTKNGKNPGQEMAFIEISDEDGSLEAGGVLFPDYWQEYKNMILEGNCVLFCGKRSSDPSRESFIIELIEQM